MSVWEETTYKLDVAKTIYKYTPNIITRVLGETAGSFLAPKGELCEITANDDWETVSNILGWESEYVDDESAKEISKLVQGVKHWSVGMHGVYAIIGSIYLGNFEVRDQYDYKKIDARLRAICSVVAPSTMITPQEFEKKWNKVDRKLVDRSRLFENCAEAWKFCARCINTSKDEFIMFDQEKYFGDGERVYYGGSVGTMIILRGSAGFKEKGVILTRKHLDMLIGACLRIAGIYDYTAREYAHDKVVVERVTQMLDLTVLAASKCTRKNSDKVVQAFHKARAYMQMRMFENQMRDAMNEACEEFQKKNLQTVIDLNKYVACFIGLPKGRWLDVLHVYKWMPPPDFDATYAFTELNELHMTTRSSALDFTASAEMKYLWGIVVRERKLNVATAYRKQFNKWPPSLATTDNFPTEDQLDEWEPKAIFPYYVYGKDVTGQIKDKATVLPKMEDEMRSKEKSYEKSFLLWYLINYDKVDTREIASNIVRHTLQEDNYVRVAYKGEAHKPGSRLFFMAPPLQRLALGEMEGNISRVASTYPASLQGIDSLTRASKLDKLFSLEPSSFSVDTGEPYTGYIVTFDLSKFSPRFNPAVLKDLHLFWAKVFDYAPIVDYARLGAYSTILHTTNNLIMSYKNKGADLEGFRGRMMTLFHADLIAAACRHAKDLGYILGKSHSAVFIDDGAVKIAAAGSGSVAKENALKFLKCMQKVYAAAGQENHPNKTIVSALGGELLAEQYLYGQRIKCAIKAGMRLFPSYETQTACITEEFDAMFSTAQGSVKDGGDWVLTYRRLAEGYLKAIYRWSRDHFRTLHDAQFAFRFVTPKSLGGFGFPTLQSLVTTAAYDMVSEGLGLLSAAGKAYPVYEGYIRKILNRPVIVRTPLQILRDPTRVRLAGPVIIEGRMANAIVEKMCTHKGPWSGFMHLLSDEELIVHAEAVATALLSQPSVSLPVLKRVWDCVPLSYVEGIVQKFQRSKSIQAILTTGEITRIRRKNQRDVRILVRTFF